MDELSELGNIADDYGTDEAKQDILHPWPYLKELFDVVGSENNSWRMRCALCQPRNHKLLAFKNSPSNVKKHLEVKVYFQLQSLAKLASSES